ncbi:MAG: acyl-CoA dehydrogenase family protein [Solirubrobacterales bacterium]
MDFSTSDVHGEIRSAVAALCKGFPDAYWRSVDHARAYPEEFVGALTAAGWLAILVPERFGGAGLGITEAGIVLEEINAAGGNAAVAHAQMYTMGALVRHGRPDQQEEYLRAIARGDLRLQAFAVTEPDAGSDTTRIRTFARRDGDAYVVDGQKIFISRTMHSDLMLLLARTTPYDELDDKSRGLSLFLVDLREAQASGQLAVRAIETMLNHHTTEVVMNALRLPATSLVGTEGEGFRHVLESWNAERTLVASEAIGDGHWFVRRASEYATGRIVFGRPIGANQAVQHPIAQGYAQVIAAALVRDKAAWLYDSGQKCGAEANMAKLLASQASWATANACLDAYGGYGFATEYDVERKFRETRLLLTAPISNSLILNFLGHNVLGMPRSY